MKTFKYLIVALLTAALCIGIFYMYSSTKISIGSDHNINVTPLRVEEIKAIGEWEFLRVVDEVVVDTIRHHTLMPDDRLTLIYNGTLRLGIDLKHVREDWVRNENDTVRILLPRPKLLDDSFIDEASTVVFYQRGSWGASAREAMYRRAARQMRAYALTPENILSVRNAAESRFTSIFESIGAKNVIVEFEDMQ